MTQTIKDILDRITWDWQLESENFFIYYKDRVQNILIEKCVDAIIRTEDSHIVIENKDCEEVLIPMHRIVLIKEKIYQNQKGVSVTYKVWLDRR